MCKGKNELREKRGLGFPNSIMSMWLHGSAVHYFLCHPGEVQKYLRDCSPREGLGWGREGRQGEGGTSRGKRCERDQGPVTGFRSLETAAARSFNKPATQWRLAGFLSPRTHTLKTESSQSSFILFLGLHPQSAASEMLDTLFLNSHPAVFKQTSRNAKWEGRWWSY